MISAIFDEDRQDNERQQELKDADDGIGLLRGLNVHQTSPSPSPNEMEKRMNVAESLGRAGFIGPRM
jgi:hypothetical protein